MSSSKDPSELQQTWTLSETQRASARGRATPGARPVSLVLFHHGGVRVVPLKGKLVVGRAPSADVVVDDRSLSREHARFDVSGEEIWVEDLGSTNGTWVGGERVRRGRAAPGTELRLGAVPAALFDLAPIDLVQLDLDGHDRFCKALEAEVSRSMAHDHQSGVLLVRAGDRSANLAGWLPRVRGLLRPYDVIALYSADIVELLIPETEPHLVEALAERLVSEDGLRCGSAMLPQDVTSAEGLLEAALSALHGTSADHPSRRRERGRRGAPAERPSTAPIFHNKVMRKLLATAKQVARSRLPLLILGETGVGKEVLASIIHEEGPRSGQPMFAINCGGLAPQLVESTLFGHEQGAFTNAHRANKGVFEAADGGTIFLDEVGDLPAEAQSSLLRVLETGRFCPVGSVSEIAVDVRVVAATNKDLEALCDQGRFRRDLLFRLNAVSLEIPPLRERLDELLYLTQRFIEQANRANGTSVRRLDEVSMELLRSYLWPGNVRELRNVIERAVVLSRDDVIRADDLPDRLRLGLSVEGASKADLAVVADRPPLDLANEVKLFEADMILEALRETDWNRKETARRLGLPVRTLAHKMRGHGIRRTEG